LSTLGADVPPELERLISRCLRKDVSRRAQHASDVKLGLEELREDSTSGTLATSARPRSRRRGGLTIGAIAIGVALAALAWQAWPRQVPPPAAFTAAPLTTLPGSEQYASFSPDATQVVFEWTPEGAAANDVYVQLVSGAPSTSPWSKRPPRSSCWC
jgi:hypothetical protein